MAERPGEHEVLALRGHEFWPSHVVAMETGIRYKWGDDIERSLTTGGKRRAGSGHRSTHCNIAVHSTQRTSRYGLPGRESSCAYYSVLTAGTDDALGEFRTIADTVPMDECVLRTHEAVLMHGDNKARLS